MAKIKAETLLRKIQKGSISSASSKPGGKSSRFSFSGDSISMFRKREIVQPYLHYIDSKIVNDQVEQSVKNALRSVDKDIDKEYSKLLPSHLVNDLYSLYYNPSERMKFDSLNKTNGVKFDILDSINNSLVKIVTNNSHIGSYIYTEEISKFLYKRFMSLPPEEQEKLKKALQNCNQGGEGDEESQEGEGKPKRKMGKGKNQGGDEDIDDYEDMDDSGSIDSNGEEESTRKGDNSSRGGANNSHGNNSNRDMSQKAADKLAKDLDQALNSRQAQKELDQAFKAAEEKMNKLKDVGVDIENDEEMPLEERREVINNLNNLDSIRSSLSRLNTSKDKILKAVSKILNGTTNYFSQKCITTDVELFEADQILDINGVELLHPFFRKSRILDMSITERKYIGKFDLYIDCSGSMGAGCGGDLGTVCRIDLAKALAMQMKELGILGDLYEFEDRPKKIANTDMNILMMSARGGTNIENVVQNILTSGNNSVVLTDGESHVSKFTHKAFFIGIGTDFHYFKNYQGAGQQFVSEGQCIYYNGKDFVDAVL